MRREGESGGSVGKRRDKMGRAKGRGRKRGEGFFQYISIYLHIPSHTFIYLYIPLYTFTYFQIASYTFIYPHILQIFNIRQIRDDIRPKNHDNSTPRASPRVRHIGSYHVPRGSCTPRRIKTN